MRHAAFHAFVMKNSMWYVYRVVRTLQNAMFLFPHFYQNILLYIHLVSSLCPVIQINKPDVSNFTRSEDIHISAAIQESISKGAVSECQLCNDQLSTWILKLAALSETGKSIVHWVKMKVWKKCFLIRKINIYSSRACSAPYFS